MRRGSLFAFLLEMAAIVVPALYPTSAYSKDKAGIGFVVPFENGESREPENTQRCTTDGLIHAEESSAITKRVKESIRLLEDGINVRGIAALTFPCGFHLDPRTGWNLILTNGTETRRYVENNPFGFSPPFGFGEKGGKPYTLNYKPVTDAELPSDHCVDQLRNLKNVVQRCSSSIGSGGSIFGITTDDRRARISYYTLHDSKFSEDFRVAEVNAQVESMFFLPLPDARGGTITLILSDSEGVYRVFLDTQKG